MRGSLKKDIFCPILYRFPETETMMKLGVLGMRPLHQLNEDETKDWGDSEIRELAEFYCTEQQHRDGEDTYTSEPFINTDSQQVVEEWRKAKMFAKWLKYPVGSIPELWFLLQRHHKEDIEHVVQLVHVALTHPVHTSDCERSFSVQNLTKTCLRSRLTDEHCGQIMRIIIEGGPIEDFNFDLALAKWKKKTTRKIFGKKSA